MPIVKNKSNQKKKKVALSKVGQYQDTSLTAKHRSSTTVTKQYWSDINNEEIGTNVHSTLFTNKN